MRWAGIVSIVLALSGELSAGNTEPCGYSTGAVVLLTEDCAVARALWEAADRIESIAWEEGIRAYLSCIDKSGSPDCLLGRFGKTVAVQEGEMLVSYLKGLELGRYRRCPGFCKLRPSTRNAYHFSGLVKIQRHLDQDQPQYEVEFAPLP